MPSCMHQAQRAEPSVLHFTWWSPALAFPVYSNLWGQVSSLSCKPTTAWCWDLSMFTFTCFLHAWCALSACWVANPFDAHSWTNMKSAETVILLKTKSSEFSIQTFYICSFSSQQNTCKHIFMSLMCRKHLTRSATINKWKTLSYRMETTNFRHLSKHLDQEDNKSKKQQKKKRYLINKITKIKCCLSLNRSWFAFLHP